MAQKVTIQLVDDIDGSEAVETVGFSLDGKHYEIDLSETNAANLRRALGDFVNVARKAGRKPRVGSAGGAYSGARTTQKVNAQIREWARTQGYEVSDRGAVPAEIRKAYDAAQAQTNDSSSSEVAAPAFSGTPAYDETIGEMERLAQ